MAVCTIKAGLPFYKVLAKGLLERFPDWSRIRILVYTHHVHSALQDALALAAGDRPCLLPEIKSLHEEFIPIEWERPRRVDPIFQRLFLSYVLHKKQTFSLKQAWSIAQHLACQSRPDESWFAETLTAWHTFLAETNSVDATTYRHAYYQAVITQWQQTPPQTPVIAVGGFPEDPALTPLLQTLAKLEQGLIIIPEENSWDFPQDAHRLNLTEFYPWTPSPDLQPIECLEFRTQEQESTAIALILRQILERSDQTALVVSPSTVRERIAAKLQRWSISVADTREKRFKDTDLGHLLRLSVRCLETGGAPLAGLAVLKHSAVSCGYEPRVFRHLIHQLEKTVLRPAEGTISDLPSLRRAISLSKPDDLVQALLTWIDGFIHACHPFLAVLDVPTPLADLLSFHRVFIEFLLPAKTAQAITPLFHSSIQHARRLQDLHYATLIGREYSEVFDCLIDQPLRPIPRERPCQITVAGILEACYHSADVVILATPDPIQGGPELVETLSHWMQFPRVIVTHVETQDSPWFRLTFGEIHSSDSCWHRWAETLDRPSRPPCKTSPAPRPPTFARPKTLSMTDIEDLIRDPYGFYARKILSLIPLKSLRSTAKSSTYGHIVHRILADFATQYPEQLPENAYDTLVRLGREAFEKIPYGHTIRAFWHSRFVSQAQRLIVLEQELRKHQRVLEVEIEAALQLEISGVLFTLTARLDRLDQTSQGRLKIIDYKTGALPALHQRESGHRPQLILEGMILAKGGLTSIESPDLEGLYYIPLADPVLTLHPAVKSDSLDSLLSTMEHRLRELLGSYMDPCVPFYLNRNDPAPDYTHLARLREA